MHWGRELLMEPLPYQLHITKHLMSLGVQVIIGSHPHMLQPHCIHGNKTVAYSLGNFLFPPSRTLGGNLPVMCVTPIHRCVLMSQPLDLNRCFLCYVLFCCVLLCSVVLRSVVFCCVVSCCVVLCCVGFCFVLFCFVLVWFGFILFCFALFCFVFFLFCFLSSLTLWRYKLSHTSTVEQAGEGWMELPLRVSATFQPFESIFLNFWSIVLDELYKMRYILWAMALLGTWRHPRWSLRCIYKARKCDEMRPNMPIRRFLLYYSHPKW